MGVLKRWDTSSERAGVDKKGQSGQDPVTLDSKNCPSTAKKKKTEGAT